MEWVVTLALQRITLADRPLAGAEGFADAAGAAHFLRPLLDFPEARRGLADAWGAVPRVHDDAAMVEGLARDLVLARLWLRVERLNLGVPSRPALEEAAPPPRAAAPPAMPEPPPPATELPGVDEAALAAMLRQAAQDHVPFCIPCMMKTLGQAA